MNLAEQERVAARLARARVGIVGLGGLGSNVAWMLVRAGVGALVLADPDSVDASNLDRQFYFLDQVGMAKTEALAENLRRIRSDVRLDLHQRRIAPDDIALLFGRCDALVEAVDAADAKAPPRRCLGLAATPVSYT
ncbi:MAG: ThiF family adenylyltransferase, partial [Coriobacteriia bacterium]|nr:ThiF family adenylyltransferase [Coriobacteriia bacterium]